MSKVTRRTFLQRAATAELGLWGALGGCKGNNSASGGRSQTEKNTGIEGVEELTCRDGSYADCPAIASDRNGNAWVAWLARLKGDQEVVLARQYQDSWLPSVRVTPRAGKYECPRLACAPGGKPLALWIRVIQENWMLESSVFDRGSFTEPVAVGSGPGKAANPCLAFGDDGACWLAWESYDRGRFQIRLNRFAQGKWGEPIAVTDGMRNSYDPAVAVDGKSGKIWVAFSAVTEQFDKAIYLTGYDLAAGKLGDEIEIVRGGLLKNRPNFNTHPAVECDREGRVWIAFERDSNRTQRVVPVAPWGWVPGNNYGYHECPVLCYDHGKVLQVRANSPEHRGRNVLVGANDHYPALLHDGAGRLWLFARTSNPRRRGWALRASCLGGDKGWIEPANVLEGSRMGRLSKPAVAIADRQSFWVAWQADNVLGKPAEAANSKGQAELPWGKSEDNVPELIGMPAVANYDSVDLVSGIFVARVQSRVAGPPLQPATLEAAADPSAGSTLPTAPLMPGRPWIPRRQLRTAAGEYTLIFGDLHEHTNISRCWPGGEDGTCDDDYRYGRDIEGFDFVALTDHGLDLYEMKWRETRRAAQFYNDPPHFVALSAYEWTKTKWRDGVFPGNGHRNVVFARDEDAAKFVSPGGTVYNAFHPDSDTPVKLWKLLREKGITGAVTIPHHSADRDHPTDWNFHDPGYQTVVEMFQARQSQEYEGCPRQAPSVTRYKGAFVQDALARGYRLGFIASGDHCAMGVGLAALYVKEVSRKGILEALRARRCYGTTGDKIFLDFRVNGHCMGTEFTVDGNPRITATIEATDQIENVVVFKNNKIIYEKKSNELGAGRNASIDFVDIEFSGSSYFYVRVMQTNNEIAWASPIWVNRAA
jgi:hypothetical protein